MTSFTNLLSSLGEKPQGPQASSSDPQKASTSQPTARLNGASDRLTLIPNNAAAGVKRRSEEPQVAPTAKAVKMDRNGSLSARPSSASSNRFQLSARPNAFKTTSSAAQRLGNAVTASSNPQRAIPKPVSKDGGTNTPTGPGSSDGTAAKRKRGFASIMEKAKAAQAASSTGGPGGIKHKAAEKLSKRERLRMAEEAKTQQRAARTGHVSLDDRSRSGTPANGVASKTQGSAYLGTMKKRSPEPLSYRGSMRAAGSHPKPALQKGRAQDKYGGYASWSDLDDVDDEEEDYNSEGLSDMEGGFDDVETEEAAALRLAKKEDREALEEEERHRREKSERMRKLEVLAAKKKR